VVGACRETGVRRLVHVSALGVSDEGTTAYLRTKWEGEQVVRRSDLDWTILRPSMIHGPEGDFIRMAAKLVRGETPPWMFIPYFTRPQLSSEDVPLAAIHQIDPVVQPIAVEDVAAAVAAALEKPEAVGEVYNLVGSEALTWPGVLRHIRDRVRRGREDLTPRGVPSDKAALLARMASKVGLGALLPFDEGMARMAAMDSTANAAKARAHLGLEARPFRASFDAYARSIP
jgi:NADH dehydrogenase